MGGLICVIAHPREGCEMFIAPIKLLDVEVCGMLSIVRAACVHHIVWRLLDSVGGFHIVSFQIIRQNRIVGG